jgi:hypothetical protein
VPVVRPNGTVVVPIVGLDSPLFLFTISSFISPDGGASWSSQFLISEADFRPPSGNLRAGIPLPSAEVDRSGRVYVTWSDCRFRASCSSSDLVLSTSTDGIVWSAVRRIPIDPVRSTVDHFIPGLGVDVSTPSRSARLALAYYFYPIANCQPETCQLDVGLVTSNDGGRTWSAPQTLAGPMRLNWLANTNQGRMVGDYISTSIVPNGGAVRPVFAVANPPAGDLFDEAMYTISDGLAGGGAGQTVAADPVLHHAATKQSARSAQPAEPASAPTAF